MLCGHSLSHNCLNCLLFILKSFSFHSSTMVLFFKMFRSTKCLFYTCMVDTLPLLLSRSSIRPVYKRRSLNDFFDSLNAWTAIFFFYLFLLLLISSSINISLSLIASCVCLLFRFLRTTWRNLNYFSLLASLTVHRPPITFITYTFYFKSCITSAWIYFLKRRDCSLPCNCKLVDILLLYLMY